MVTVTPTGRVFVSRNCQFEIDIDGTPTGDAIIDGQRLHLDLDGAIPQLISFNRDARFPPSPLSPQTVIQAIEEQTKFISVPCVERMDDQGNSTDPRCFDIILDQRKITICVLVIL